VKVWIVNTVRPSSLGHRAGPRHTTPWPALSRRGESRSRFSLLGPGTTSPTLDCATPDPGTRACAGCELHLHRLPAARQACGSARRPPGGMLRVCARGFRRAVRRRVGDAQVLGSGSTPSAPSGPGRRLGRRRAGGGVRLSPCWKVRDHLAPSRCSTWAGCRAWHPRLPDLIGAPSRARQPLAGEHDRIVHAHCPWRSGIIRTVFPRRGPVSPGFPNRE
jgi:hypothetical protein